MCGGGPAASRAKSRLWGGRRVAPTGYSQVSGTSNPWSFAALAADVTELARTINRQRQADRLSELRARSLTSGHVIELVASISDRKDVDRRRAARHPRRQADAAPDVAV